MTTTLLLLALAVACAWMFNRLVRDRNQVHVAWSDVDVQLQRRHDLVPVLAETVRGYAGHESELLGRVTRERTLAQSSNGPAARGEAEQVLGGDLGRLIALGEAYPDLKASTNFVQLSAELVEIEDAIQHARRFYNGSVRQYNTHLQRFPDLLIAHALRFQPAQFFAADDDARATVAVHLD
ncbi:LemA family protein [Rhodanobacter sp. AS-Z3]|uniref:LemA family protein n=1 Tax=Rhodanobacter sp. AS-Z3 TaxID=3031330 RepID=UPI002479FEC8|nr:LemA family protein [Rhodanobacter sp. AS-Z3]WEN15148.1 LemA family protein [Rhodanobacter sp. AS-Z3]